MGPSTRTCCAPRRRPRVGRRKEFGAGSRTKSGRCLLRTLRAFDARASRPQGTRVLGHVRRRCPDVSTAAHKLEIDLNFWPLVAPTPQHRGISVKIPHGRSERAPLTILKVCLLLVDMRQSSTSQARQSSTSQVPKREGVSIDRNACYLGADHSNSGQHAHLASQPSCPRDRRCPALAASRSRCD